MKAQCIKLDQTYWEITDLMITAIKSFNFNSFFSTGKAGHYLLPLVKQIFRDNFMGSEMEMGIILLFIKNYLLIAIDYIRHNALTDRFKKVRAGLTKNAMLPDDDFSLT